MSGTKKTESAPPDNDEAPRATPSTAKNKAKNSKLPDNSESKAPPSKKRNSAPDNDEAPRTAPTTSKNGVKNTRTPNTSKAKAPPKKKTKTKKNAQSRTVDENVDDDEVEVVYIPAPTHGSDGRELRSVEAMDANLMRNIMTRRGGEKHANVSRPMSRRSLMVNLRVREWMATRSEFRHHTDVVANDEGDEDEDEREEEKDRGDANEEVEPVIIDLDAAASISVSDQETLINESSQTISGSPDSGSGSGVITPEEAARDENDRTHGAEILMGMQAANANGDEGGERESEREDLEHRARERKELQERARELEREKMDLAGILAGMARGEGARS